MPGWMNHKLESRLQGEKINNLRYADDTALMAESEKELKSLLLKVKKESEKVGLKPLKPTFETFTLYDRIMGILIFYSYS